MPIYIPPQGDITINESAIKNTDAEIRDGVWADSTKAHGANISSIYGNTSTLIKNTSLILVMGSNDATLENQSTIIQYNQTIDSVVDAVQAVTDLIPDSGAMSSVGTVVNQSLILTDGDNLLANTSSLIGSNSTIDTVADAIKTITDALPDSGALTSIGTMANQSLILTDGDNLLTNTSSLIGSNATIDAVVDTINDDTKLRFVAAGNKSIASGAEKYLNIDSGTDGAEIISITIKGVVAADWTVELYIPTDDGVTAPAAGDKRAEETYTATDAEAGQIAGIGAIRYNMFLDVTNDSAGSADIDEVITSYRSAGTLTATWET